MAEVRGPAARWLSLAAGLALAACAAGGPLTVAPQRAAALPGFLAHSVRASDGSALAVTGWGPAEPRAVILAFHGFGDHGQSTFAHAAGAWAERGIATVAVDQRGFGRNPSRGRWPGADGLVADAVAVSRQIRARFPCAPLVAVGHSMGGGVVLAAAAKGLEADGLVLAAPAIWGGEYLNPVYRMVAWTAALVAPDRRFTGRGVVRIQASDNLEALREMRDDPLYLGRPSARELMGLVRVTDRAEAAVAAVDRPALMLLGARDQIVPNRRVRRIFAGLAGPGSVIEYPEGWHLLFRDLQAPRVWRDVANWALARTPPTCAATAPGGPLPATLSAEASPAGQIPG